MAVTPPVLLPFASCSIPFRSGPSSSLTVAEKNVLMQDHTDDHEASSKPTVTTALMPSKAPAEPVLYIRRWIILLLFSLVSMMNACTWITFSPFASKAAAFYGVNSLAIDMFSLCFMIFYIPCIFLSSYLIGKYGLRFGMIVAGVLNTLGVWIRYGGTVPASPIYAVVLIGQILCAAAQIFILQVPPLIANDWFGQKERTFATSVGADFNQLGVAIGFLMGAFMVKESTDIKMLILAQAVATTIPAVLAAVFVRDRPMTPPSFAASQKVDAASSGYKSSFIEDLKMLIFNRSYMILWVNFGLIIGAFYAVSTVLPLLLEKYNYSSNDGGFLGFILTVVGIAGAIGVGILCDKTHWYKEILIGVNIGNMAAFIWLAMIVKPDNYAHLAVNQSILGLFITGAIPAYLEASAEASYPHVSEDFAAGMLIMGAQVFGIILTFVMSYLIQSNNHIGVLWLAVGVTGVTVLLGLFVVPKYRRLEAERAASQMAAEGHKIGNRDEFPATVAVSHDSGHLEVDEPPHRVFVAKQIQESHTHQSHHHKTTHHGHKSHSQHNHHRHTQSASPHEHDSTFQDLDDPHDQHEEHVARHRHKHVQSEKVHHHKKHGHDDGKHTSKSSTNDHHAEDVQPKRGLHDAITM